MIHYLTIPSADFAIERVAQRVSKGGHHVPSDDVRRRFERIHINFIKLCLPMADRWYIWDSSAENRRLLAQHDDTDIATLKQILAMNSPDTLRETPVSPELARAFLAANFAYQDALAENKRWGLPMIPPVNASASVTSTSYKQPSKAWSA